MLHGLEKPTTAFGKYIDAVMYSGKKRRIFRGLGFSDETANRPGTDLRRPLKTLLSLEEQTRLFRG